MEAFSLQIQISEVIQRLRKVRRRFCNISQTRCEATRGIYPETNSTPVDGTSTERVKENGIISPVEGHTKWCAGMVVVPKAKGKVRICVDLTKLNESVLRENHPQPCVDYTLAQLAGAKIFSKLDANSGRSPYHPSQGR